MAAEPAGVHISGTLILGDDNVAEAFLTEYFAICLGMNVHAHRSNKSPINIGDAAVTLTGTPIATDGRTLAPGEEERLGPFLIPNELYAVGLEGEKIDWVATILYWEAV